MRKRKSGAPVLLSLLSLHTYWLTHWSYPKFITNFLCFHINILLTRESRLQLHPSLPYTLPYLIKQQCLVRLLNIHTFSSHILIFLAPACLYPVYLSLTYYLLFQRIIRASKCTLFQVLKIYRMNLLLNLLLNTWMREQRPTYSWLQKCIYNSYIFFFFYHSWHSMLVYISCLRSVSITILS